MNYCSKHGRVSGGLGWTLQLSLDPCPMAPFQITREPVVTTRIPSHNRESIWKLQAELVVLHICRPHRPHRPPRQLRFDSSGRKVSVEQFGPRPVGEGDQIHLPISKHRRHLTPRLPPHVQECLCLGPSALCIERCPDYSILSQPSNRQEKRLLEAVICSQNS